MAILNATVRKLNTDMNPRSLHDIYRCPHCRAIATRGNNFCRECGVGFTSKDLEMMENNIRSPVGALPWNTRDRFRCVHCSENVAISDTYCRGCGDKIEDHERQLMRLRLSELAKKDLPSLIGLGVFVQLEILASVLVVT